MRLEFETAEALSVQARQYNDYAVKRNRNGAVPGIAVSAPPSPIVGGIDWRFADPDSDALAGFHFSTLSESVLGRALITQLGAKQGLSEADVDRLLEGLAGVDRSALCIRDNRILAMLTGRFPDPPLPAQEAGLKFAPVPGNMMLFGHADAVEQALKRIATTMPAGSVEFAEEWQATSDIWVIGVPVDRRKVDQRGQAGALPALDRSAISGCPAARGGVHIPPATN